MGKRILMFLFVSVFAVGMVFSQSNTGKQINDIKRDGQYFYAESTLETEEKAHETATLMLANFINDYINSNRLPHDKKIVEQDLAKAQSLSMKRGPMVRVFLYVKKSDFVPLEAGNEPTAKEELVADAPVVEAPVVKKEPTPEKEPVSVKESAPEKEPAKEVEKPEPEAKAADTLEQSVSAESNKSDAQPTAQPDEAAGSNPMLLSVPWQQAAIDDMLKKSSLPEVIVLLNRLKAEYKVKRIGTYPESKNAALSFWVVCENDSNNSLITILGPGTDSRVNFKTLQHDSLGNYSGKNAMWFDFAK